MNFIGLENGERVVLVAYGDNANLSTSVAKTIGALLHESIADRPESVALRRQRSFGSSN